MEEMVFEFFENYGWRLTLIACSGILVLGILKFFNIFKKVDKSKRKYIYAAISSGFSIVTAAVYLLANDAFDWAGFGVTAGAIYILNQTLYTIYETYGFRSLLQKFGNLFISVIAKTRIESAKAKLVEENDDGIIDDLNMENNVDELDRTVTNGSQKLETNNLSNID